MIEPGLYMLDGCLFVATEAPECYFSGKPGKRIRALKGHFLKAGIWKSSGTVDADARKVEMASDLDVLEGLIATAPESVQAMLRYTPSVGELIEVDAATPVAPLTTFAPEEDTAA